MSALRVTVLGCGGAMGTPMVGGGWGQCDPNEPRNHRRRPSILVRSSTTTILVDTSPDCRAQLLDAGIEQLDAVLYTHGHADHVHGIDDVRPFTFTRKAPIPAFADAATRAEIEAKFTYAVASRPADGNFGRYAPLLAFETITGPPIGVGDLTAIPFRQRHGTATSLGFRFGRFAYSTDVSGFDDEVIEHLQDLDVWILDACQEVSLPGHFSLEAALGWIDRMKPRRAYLTHLSHRMDYATISAKLPNHVRLAHDGLEIVVG